MPPATKTPLKPAVAAPERSLTQRMEALQRANEIRTRRAQLKRDLKGGRVSIHDLLLEPPEYVETAKVFDMLLAVPEVRPGEGQQGARAVPHLAEQDDRRPVAAPAHRAGQHAPPLAVGGLARVFVITGPSGVGKGTLIRTLLERVPELELSVSATTRRPRPGETQGVAYHFLSDEEFERRVAAGEFVEHARYSGRRYGTLRSELEGGSPAAIPSCSRSRSRARARSASRCPRRCRSSSRRRARTRCARGSSAAAPTTPSRSRRGSRPRARSSRAQGEFAHVVVNDRLEDASDALEACVRALPRAARLTGPAVPPFAPKDHDLISPRVDRLLENVDSPYASVVVAAKRARQINSYYHNLGEGTFEEFPPPMIDTGSKNYLTIALEEVAEGKIKYRYRG